MSLYIDCLQDVSSTGMPDEKEVLEVMKDYYKSGVIIIDTMHLVTFCKLLCKNTGKKIKGLTIAGHGSSMSFRIGQDRIWLDTLDPLKVHPDKRHIAPALATLRPLFEKGAWVRIDACQCGLNEKMLKRLSAIMGVAVFAWTGEQVYTQNGSDISVDRQGGQVVCVGQMCHTF